MFGPRTSPQVQKLAQSIEPYDLLKAYRDGVNAFGTNDIVLLVVITGNEMHDFQSWPRAAYVARSMNAAAKQLHPVGRQSAHKALQMPPIDPAFWLVFELHDDETILAAAVGTHKYEVADESASLSEMH